MSGNWYDNTYGRSKKLWGDNKRPTLGNQRFGPRSPFFQDPNKLPANYLGRPGATRRGRPERWEDIMPGSWAQQKRAPYDQGMQNWRDRETYGQGLPQPSNQVPSGGFAPQAHKANLANAWAPWFGGRELTPGESRMVNPPAYTAPRDRIVPKQVRRQIWEPPPVNATGRPLEQGRAQGPSRGRYINDPSGAMIDDPSGAQERILGQVTPEMQNILEELRRQGYAPSGGADFNPQWGTTGGMGPSMGWSPPPEEEGGAVPGPSVDTRTRGEQVRDDFFEYKDEAGQGWWRGGVAPSPDGKGQPGGMATSDPTGRQQEGGQALGAPVGDLDGFMSWLGNDDQGIKILYDWYIQNGVDLPDGFMEGYRLEFEKGREWTTDGWEYPGDRNDRLLTYVRRALQQGRAGYEGGQPDPTQTDPNTENIPGLEDRDTTPGTGFPWAPNLTDPGSQDAPGWVDAWQNQISEYMPQIADQYRAISNQGVYGPAGMQTIRAPLQNATNQVLGSMEPWLNETTAGIRQSEANQRRRALQATQGGMGRLGAQRPGAAAQSVATNITMPSMVAESDRIFGARQDMKSLSDQLVMGMGQFDTDLTRENMLSKSQVGLPGMAGTFGQMSSDLARRSWDKSMENKFGWSPERQGETQWRIMDYFRDKDFTINWNMGQQNAMLGDWGQSRSQQRQYEYAALLMELKQKYDKEMAELFGDDWYDKLMKGIFSGAGAYKDIKTGGG